MKKVQDKVLAEKIEGLIAAAATDETAATAVVEMLRETQDAGGLKVVQTPQ